jgi:hypothetical protein
MSGTTQRFAIRWSLSTWVLTIGAVAVVCIGLTALAGTAIHVPPHGTILRALLALEGFVLIAILAVVAALAPLGYSVSEDSIVVRRLAHNVVIPRASIRDVRRLARRDVGFAWRLFGSGGLLGFFGYFSSAKLGRFLAYAADTASLVLITQTDGRKILISPYPPEEFLRLLQRSPSREV